MLTDQQLTIPTVSETVVRQNRAYIPWRAAPTLAMQALETKIRRRFAHIITEVVDEPVYGHNPDIPDARHRIEQGYEHPVNDHLEKPVGAATGSMDNGHFRDLCVQRGPSHARLNHVLHLKSKAQLRPKTWLRPEYIAGETIVKDDNIDTAHLPNHMRRLVSRLFESQITARKVKAIADIPHDLTLQVIEAFKTLGISDWPTAKRLLVGRIGTGRIYIKRDCVVKTGLKGVVLKAGIKTAKDPARFAAGIVNLARKLERPLYECDRPSFRIRSLGEMWDEHLTYGLDVQTGYDEPDTDDMADEDIIDPLAEPPKDDELDSNSTDNAFSSHPLFGDGTDSLPYEIEYRLSTAEAPELKRFSALMFPRFLKGGSDPEFEFTESQRANLRQRLGVADHEIDLAEVYIQDPKRCPAGSRINPALVSYGAIKVPAHFWHFSPSQEKHFWALWKARKQELANAAKAEPNFKRLLSFVTTGQRNEVAAAIYAYRDGNKFDLFGVETVIDGTQTPTKETLSELWSLYKKRFAA